MREPRSRTRSRIPSRSNTSNVATPAAQASGCPEYVRPPWNATVSKCAAIRCEITTPPSGT